LDAYSFSTNADGDGTDAGAGANAHPFLLPTTDDGDTLTVTGARNVSDGSKWILAGGHYYPNPNYVRPWYDLGLEGAATIPPLIGAAAAILPETGPAGLLFGRANYRNSEPSIFNSGDPRFGWSWNKQGWAGARNYFGPHGGVPHTDTHWHGTYMPGPKGPLW
jgi:hypothetical protein